MSWFESKSGLTSRFQSLLKEAQKQIDKALDIQDEDVTGTPSAQKNDNREVIALSTDKKKTEITETEKQHLTSSWDSQSMGSFFQNPNANEMITTPPKALSSPKLNIDVESTSVSPNVSSKVIDEGRRKSLTVDAVFGSSSSILDSAENQSTSLTQLLGDSSADSIEHALLPDSIVIVERNETAQQESLSESVLTLVSADNEVTANANNSEDADITNDSHTADSNSTQSFEEIQMNSSDNQCEDYYKGEQKIQSSCSHSSNHNSNDEMETTTSSDIEIISNPNGDSSSTNSAMRFTSVLIKKGHCREPSEISVLSEDSQSELDKLLHRINELKETLETRDLRILNLEHENTALHERSNELQVKLDTIKNSASGLDSAEEFTQRLSSLEKKFQSSICERDSLRIQIKSLTEELKQKIPKDELIQSNTMIEELRLEGEKLSKEILQQSNIIKKLRAKEKTSDALLKKNKDQISILTDELERLKKSLNAKEEMERTQIEAVYKLSSEKQKLLDENNAYLKRIDDLQTKFAIVESSLESAKIELQHYSKQDYENTKAKNEGMVLQLTELREKQRILTQSMVTKEKQLREENRDLLRRLEAAELRAESSSQDVSLTTIPLMQQIQSLQDTLTQRTNTWAKDEKRLLEKLETSQSELKSLENNKASFTERLESLQMRTKELEEKLSRSLIQEEKSKILLHEEQNDFSLKESTLQREISALNEKVKILEEEKKNLEESLKRKEELMTRCSTQQDLAELTEAEQCKRSVSPAASYGANSFEDAAVGNLDWQPDDLDCVSNSGRQTSGFIQGIHFNLLGHNATTLEHLHSLLKQRDGENSQLQWQISRLQADRSVLNDDISSLTSELENIREKLLSFETMESSFADLQHKYDALLQLYGEKVERTEELELDLIELKDAYKIQIDELLAQPKKT